ncbi:MAG: TIGR02996 domain-containing protein [Planctomycetes bacterium]|nr:TIGR02996 domain-containing protein [Planctomycetota bacterium]
MSHPTFTDDDRAFLRAILDVPEDRNTWLIYADWLDDRGDPRAEFLRLAVARSLMAADDPARLEAEARLTQLRAELDPQWVMMFDPAPVGNCARGSWVRARCAQRWDDMAATDVPDIRICYTCREAVIYCHTIEEARQYASCGQRVALSTRIPAEAIAGAPAFQEPAPPADHDSDEFELTSDEFLDAGPPAPTPRPSVPARPWWKFW